MHLGRVVPRAAPAILGCALACLVFGPLPPLRAQEVVIYRCTDEQGQLTIQNNTPCPKGSKQVRRVMDAPPASTAPYVPPPIATPAPPPEPVPPAAPVAPPRPSALDGLPPATIADADRLPPPVLFECRTWDNDSYLSDNGNPPPRCVTLGTSGLGGLESGSGAACEMKKDSCQRVPDGALCEGWRRRLREAESGLRFGVSENQDKARAELERIGLVVRDSTCGLPSP